MIFLWFRFIKFLGTLSFDVFPTLGKIWCFFHAIFFWLFLFTCILGHSVVSQLCTSLCLLIVLKLYLFLSLSWLISTDPLFGFPTLSLAVSNLLLSLYCEFHFRFLFLFSSRLLFWSLFYIFHLSAEYLHLFDY